PDGLSSGHLFEDSAGGGGGIGGGGDGPADHDVRRSRSERLAGRGDARLVVFGGAGGAHARSDDSEAFAQLAAQRGGFRDGADFPVASGGASERRQAQHLINRAARDADFFEIGIAEAGQNGDGKDHGRLDAASCGVGCRLHHGRASAGVHGEHARAQRASSRDGRRYGVGNIVKFQVQENFVAGGNYLAHQRGAFDGEKLLAHFESGDR